MAHGAQIYFETDGDGKLFICEKQYSGKNGDFVKRTLVDEHWQPVKSTTSQEDFRSWYPKIGMERIMSKEDMKCKLNSIYGRVVSDNMRKDYIVVHKDGRPAIIFKSFIAGVFDNVLDKVYLTRIELSSGGMVLVDEDYATIVRALLQ